MIYFYSDIFKINIVFLMTHSFLIIYLTIRISLLKILIRKSIQSATNHPTNIYIKQNLFHTGEWSKINVIIINIMHRDDYSR